MKTNEIDEGNYYSRFPRYRFWDRSTIGGHFKTDAPAADTNCDLGYIYATPRGVRSSHNTRLGPPSGYVPSFSKIPTALPDAGFEHFEIVAASTSLHGRHAPACCGHEL